jgi:hypothetical protein
MALTSYLFEEDEIDMNDDNKTKDKYLRHRSPDGTKKRISITLSKSVLLVLNDMRKKTRISRAQLIEMAVYAKLRPLYTNQEIEDVITDALMTAQYEEVDSIVKRVVKTAKRAKDASKKGASKADKESEKLDKP